MYENHTFYLDRLTTLGHEGDLWFCILLPNFPLIPCADSQVGLLVRIMFMLCGRLIDIGDT